MSIASVIIEQFKQQIINSFDAQEIEFNSDEILRSVLFCKNLSDLTDIVMQIVIKFPNNPKLPNRDVLGYVKEFLSSLYKESIFKYDAEGDLIPPTEADWKQMNEDDLFICVMLLRTVKTNTEKHPLVRKSIEEKDKQFFISNFDLLFAEIPFQEDVSKFKNLLLEKLEPEDEQNVWDFIEVLVDFLE